MSLRDTPVSLLEPIQESKGMRPIFQKKGKRMLKMGKNIQNLKIF